MNRTGFHIIAEKGAMYCLASGLKTVLHHFRDTQSESDYELVKTNSVLMGAPLDGAQVDALLLHLPQRRDAAAPIFQPTARNHRHPLIRTPITAAPHIRNHVANFATTRDAAHLIFDFRAPSQPRRQNQNLPQRVKLPPRNSFPVKKPHLCKEVRKVLHTRHPMRKTHRGRA